jgi:uncharacterized protein YbjT (DUF2867 family)
LSVNLVVGAAGTVGSSVVQELVWRGERVRALSSKARRATADGVEWVQANVVSGKGLDEAFRGVDRAFIFSPPGHANQHEIDIPLIRRAQQQGLEKVVLMTALGVNANPQAPLRLAEIELENSGLSYNIVRPNWFMQNFSQAWLPGIVATGRIQLPAGLAKTSFIDTRDVGAVIARLLTSHDYDNRDFDLTGPQALDHFDVAAILSRVTGEHIQYEPIEPGVLRASLLGAGFNAAYADFLVLILGFLAAGYNERITFGVPILLGREPISFEQYAQDYRQAWNVKARSVNSAGARDRTPAGVR